MKNKPCQKCVAHQGYIKTLEAKIEQLTERPKGMCDCCGKQVPTVCDECFCDGQLVQVIRESNEK